MIVSRRRRSAAGSVGAHRAQDLVPVEQRLGRLARLTQQLEPEGVEGPDPDPCAPGPRPAARAPPSTRSRSSSAARRLKVIAQMDSGSAPSSMSQAIRATSVVVLPDPAGATHSTGPGGAVAAARWSGCETRQALGDGGMVGHRRKSGEGDYPGLWPMPRGRRPARRDVGDQLPGHGAVVCRHGSRDRGQVPDASATVAAKVPWTREIGSGGRLPPRLGPARGGEDRAPHRLPRFKRRGLLVVAASLLIAAVDAADRPARPPARFQHGRGRDARARRRTLRRVHAIKPLITVGDTDRPVTGSRRSPTGSRSGKLAGRRPVFVNHETSKVPFPYSHGERPTIDQLVQRLPQLAR